MIQRMNRGHFELPDLARRVLEILLVMPLVRAKDLAAALGIWEEQVDPALQSLEDRRWVGSVSLGSRIRHSRPARHWFLRPRALRELRLEGQTWHEEGNLCRLLGMLPALNEFYRVVGNLEGLGRLTDFFIAEGLAMDAVAGFEESWVALYWSGPQETERDVARRIDHLGEDVEVAAGGYQANWPCLMVWLACDEWQREVIRKGVPDRARHRVSILCVSGEPHVEPLVAEADGRGRLRQPVRVRDAGRYPLERRIARSIWGHPHSPAAHRALDLVAEFPGADSHLVRVREGEGPGGKLAGKVLRSLTELGLVQREKSGRTYRYHLTPRGQDVWARWNLRGTVRDYRGRVLSDSWVTRPDRRKHHEGGLDLIAKFMAAGLPVAAGWRGARHMRRQSVVPDAMVRLTQSPYLNRWTYVEYELSARSPARIRRKLRGFQHPEMENPALLVVAATIRRRATSTRSGWNLGPGC